MVTALKRRLARTEQATQRPESGRKHGPPWQPQPGRQAEVYHCQADELFYGGAAGGGKTDLLIGLAATAQTNGVIFRREFPRVRAIVERSREILGSGRRGPNSYNESLHLWRLPGRTIEFAAIQYEKDKENQRGRPRDFYGWDEITEFTETQFRFVNAWNRTTKAGQRRRIVACGNPPTNPEGEWVVRYWAPWLDGQHTNPAQPGELRWFARIDDKDVEVDGSAPIQHKKETIYPRSRTFIPALLEDNPILAATGYGAVLQGLPEPLRSQMLFGDFSIGVADGDWQVIPTAWVRAAQARWKADGKPNRRLDLIGVDVARGGDDKTVLAPRWGNWFGALEKYQGRQTPDGPAVVALIQRALMQHGNPSAIANIDVIGVGASAYDVAKDRKVNAFPINFAEKIPGARDSSGLLGFLNLRAFAYWTLRDELDPANGHDIALPPDRELLADLTAARWEISSGGIKIEPKEKIKERIGRSPDCGDAVALACLAPRRQAVDQSPRILRSL